MPTGSPLPERRLVIAQQKHQGQFFVEMLDRQTPLEMMLIPSGTFQMGQTETETTELIRRLGEDEYQELGYPDELPRHSVTVPLFFMGKYPITQAQWRVVASYPVVKQGLDLDPSSFKGDNRPVEQVSWEDATEFCQRLSQQTGRTYCLPSEAQWEYACRAGTTTPFHFGETLGDELANYCAQDQEIGNNFYPGTYGRGILGQYRQETTEVGSFPANRFGLYDLHGNVWEWCEDDYHPSYEGAPHDGSAWVESDDSSTNKLLRGGSWSSLPRGCRSASRYDDPRDYRFNLVGVRVCCLPVRTFS